MNLHRLNRPRWPYLTVDQNRKLVVTAFVSAVLAWATLAYFGQV